jgi:hypothetical protein
VSETQIIRCFFYSHPNEIFKFLFFFVFLFTSSIIKHGDVICVSIGFGVCVGGI